MKSNTERGSVIFIKNFQFDSQMKFRAGIDCWRNLTYWRLLREYATNKIT